MESFSARKVELRCVKHSQRLYRYGHITFSNPHLSTGTCTVLEAGVKAGHADVCV